MTRCQRDALPTKNHVRSGGVSCELTSTRDRMNVIVKGYMKKIIYELRKKNEEMFFAVMISSFHSVPQFIYQDL